MDKEFIPYEQALELKELGFDDGCLAGYINNKLIGCGAILFDVDGLYNNDFNDLVSTPLYQQAFRWFREKYGLYSYIEMFQDGDGIKFYKFVIYNNKAEGYYIFYEEAELACLKTLIQIIKNK